MRLCTIIAGVAFFTGCGEPSHPVKQAIPDKANKSGEETSAHETVFLYVKIPEAIMPLDRGSKYEDPIHDALVAADLGEVTGGGTMLDADGSITSVGVDIDVVDVDEALPIIVETLRKAGAPKETVIEQYEPKQIEHPVW